MKNQEVIELLGGEAVSFPKYATQIINLANQNAQGTRPKVVGQMSGLIGEFKGRKIEEWEKWYLNRHPEAIEKAKSRIMQMLNNFKQVFPLIDEKMIESWIRDLVISKTFAGLKFQEAILKRVAMLKGLNYKIADPQEESNNLL